MKKIEQQLRAAQAVRESASSLCHGIDCKAIIAMFVFNALF
jgi:hypothetical protein